MANLKKETFNGVKWYLFGDAAVIVANFVVSIILARLLTPEDYGTIGVYGIFFAIANIFINGGFSMSLIQKKDLTDSDASTAFWVNVVMGFFFYLVFFITSPLLANFFRIPILTDIIRVSALGLVLGSFSVVQTTLYNKKVDFKTTSVIKFASNIVAGVVCVVLAYMQWGVWALVTQGLIGGFITTILLWYFSKWRPQFIFSVSSFRNLFSFGGKILGTRLMECLSGQATSFVIGKFFSTQNLGYYQKGAAYSRLLSSSISGALYSVSFPVMSKIQDDDETLLYVYKRYIKITSLIIFFIMLLLGALAHPLIIILYTSRWIITAIFMQVVVLGLMFDHLVGLNNNIFLVKGKSDIVLRLQLVKSTVFLLLIMVSVPFGVLAVCFAEVVYYQIAIMLSAYQTKKLIGYGYFNQWHDIFPYLLYAFLAVIPAYLLAQSTLSHWLVVILGCICSISFYVFILMIRKDRIFHDYVIVELNNRVSAIFHK